MTDTDKIRIVLNYIDIRKKSNDVDQLLQLFSPKASISSYGKVYTDLRKYYDANPKPLIGPTSVSTPVMVNGGNVYVELYFSIFKTIKVTYEFESTLIKKMTIC
jgi:hypothetical protein